VRPDGSVQQGVEAAAAGRAAAASARGCPRERAPVGLADRREQIVACLLAAAAHLATDAAVLVVFGVTLALLARGPAREHAGLNRCADDADLRHGQPDDDAACGIADVGAIEAQANAAHQLLQVALAEVGVGATRTDHSALAARLDAADAHIQIAAARLRMGLQHLSNRHFALLSHARRCTG
jgi:hypothetical protein